MQINGQHDHILEKDDGVIFICICFLLSLVQSLHQELFPRTIMAICTFRENNW
ncbi:hypothetical protein Leryth_013184 [Lithospermum erythrorhizon]|nr:hypothetical protein Leryth_013184 [Lithospermum erythrorhizon]